MLYTVKYYTALRRTPLRTFVAIVLGFLAAVMLFLLAGTLTSYTISAGPTLAVAFVALLAGWAISAYFIRRNAATTSAVLCRGFLLGAAEWLAVIPATRTSVEDYQNLPNAVPAVVGEALIPWLAAAMATGCLIAFAVAYFVGRRVSADAPPAPSHL
jgi:hypothetical protein